MSTLSNGLLPTVEKNNSFLSNISCLKYETYENGYLNRNFGLGLSKQTNLVLIQNSCLNTELDNSI